MRNYWLSIRSPVASALGVTATAADAGANQGHDFTGQSSTQLGRQQRRQADAHDTGWFGTVVSSPKDRTVGVQAGVRRIRSCPDGL
jgi:hypothetical protein